MYDRKIHRLREWEKEMKEICIYVTGEKEKFNAVAAWRRYRRFKKRRHTRQRKRDRWKMMLDAEHDADWSGD